MQPSVFSPTKRPKDFDWSRRPKLRPRLSVPPRKKGSNRSVCSAKLRRQSVSESRPRLRLRRRDN